MGRKNRREIIGVITADAIFDAQKPRYNAHQSKCGAHGENKYNRNRKHKGKGVGVMEQEYCWKCGEDFNWETTLMMFCEECGQYTKCPHCGTCQECDD